MPIGIVNPKPEVLSAGENMDNKRLSANGHADWAARWPAAGQVLMEANSSYAQLSQPS
jgi:hypothetical protein